MADRKERVELSENGKNALEEMRKLSHEEQVAVVKSLRGLWIVEPFYGQPPREFFAISRELGKVADAVNKASTRYNMTDPAIFDLISPNRLEEDIVKEIVNILRSHKKKIFDGMKVLRKKSGKGKTILLTEE